MGKCGEKQQFIAASLFIATHKLGDLLGRGEQPRGDSFRDEPGERVVFAHIAIASLDLFLVPQNEVGLRQYLWLAGASHISPRGARLVCSPRKRPGWAAAMHVAIGVTRHTRIA